MKIRVVSDLHLDINRKFNIKLPHDDIYTLIAGDLGGEYKNNAMWLRKNIYHGAFISGNHDAYVSTKVPIEDVKAFYHNEFPVTSDITYLDESVGVLSKQINDKVLLIADVLYTDYKLKLSYHNNMKLNAIIEDNMWQCTPKMSGCYLNDFNFMTRNGNFAKYENHLTTGYYYIRPEHYLEHFNRAFKKITKLVEDNQDKDIILMTHHCLSPRCISKKYVDSHLNASYASNKEAWIKKHTNIKLVISGHVHHRSEFKLGNTLYLTNPLGYIKNNENEQSDKMNWTPNLIIDTDDWSISREKFENKNWKKLQAEYLKKQLSYLSIFGF